MGTKFMTDFRNRTRSQWNIHSVAFTSTTWIVNMLHIMTHINKYTENTHSDLNLCFESTFQPLFKSSDLLFDYHFSPIIKTSKAKTNFPVCCWTTQEVLTVWRRVKLHFPPCVVKRRVELQGSLTWKDNESSIHVEQILGCYENVIWTEHGIAIYVTLTVHRRSMKIMGKKIYKDTAKICNSVF